MSIEQDRAREIIHCALHDCIVRVPGGSRFQRFGKPIKEFGVKLAARVLGTTPDQIRNMADTNKPDHRFYFDQLVDLHLDGMDPAWLDELEHAISRVAFTVPDVRHHDDLSRELMRAIDEFGDVGRSMAEALADGRVTRKEFAHFDRECDEAIGALAELREAFRAKVK
ncbi:MAG: hypothetical protein K9M17_05440 [Mariprofundaceae bacterium]|nr:hypothetical protein [Mariprofundaceae bacterium]